MKPNRHFLDWHIPVTHQVCEWLIPSAPSHSVDLGNTLVIVPTRQAGRRLREALAQRCANYATALLPPVVSEPLFFAQDRTPNVPVAGPLLSAAVWAHVLRTINPHQYAGLFPVAPPRQDMAWAVQLGEQIQRLRNNLADGGYLIADVIRLHGNTLDEADRWHDLARLETAYLQQLEQGGLRDRPAHLISQAHTPAVSPDIKHIVVAAVPDPTPLMITALRQLPDALPLTLLVHAPESAAPRFDEWGRPRAECWNENPIDLPDPARNIRLGASPHDQATQAFRIIMEEGAHETPADLAIGVPDPEVAPYMDTLLAEQGLVAFNPAGKAVAQHRLYHALDRVGALCADPTYEAVSRVLRHPDLLQTLEHQYGIDAADLLTQLDQVQNKHLPQDLQVLHKYCSERYADTPLDKALAVVNEIYACNEWESPEDQLARIVALFYADQAIDPRNPEDDTFRTVAQRINRLVAETRTPLFHSLAMPFQDVLQLILRGIASETYFADRPDTQVDLEGWLELQWNDAPLLIITGMNEGHVPDGRMSDVFLPDALLDRLGLRSDTTRLARDAYLMTALIQSRRRDGRTCFIAGAYSRAGDPLRPSRLLFRCEKEALPDRARQLFREPTPHLLIHPASVSFTLDPARLAVSPSSPSLSVTKLAGYLACPFRFYLHHFAGMAPLSDDKRELDALDFGSIVHTALQGLRDLPLCDDPDELAAVFIQRAESRLFDLVGGHPPLPVHMQFESIRQRLLAAAAEQVRTRQEGWEPRYFEKPVQHTIHGIVVHGVIDRVDYHPEHRAWRIIDYKTRDKRMAPEEAHCGTRRDSAPDYALSPATGKKTIKQWIDLQLPLYVSFFRALEPEGEVSAAYFHLPRAVTDTGLETWDSLTEEWIDSARTCAEGVVQDIQRGRFWPPADPSRFDDFAPLFPFPAVQCIADWPGAHAASPSADGASS